MTRVCFVCLGNICRSPTAEGVMRHLLEELGRTDVEVDSAGTSAYHTGEPPDRRSTEAAAAHGVRLQGRSRPVVEADFDRFDVLVAMDHANRRALLDLAPTDEARQKVRLLRSYDPESPSEAEVPDPYYEDGFDDVFQICRRGCEGLLASIDAGRG
ncbi:MAG: low molecular weight protein-tyrosine-phosphatase [Myxococcota bacterium]